MGMFDTIHINKKFLPVVESIENNGYSLSSLQTKDFDSLLEEYHVDEDGKLFLTKVEYITVENEKISKEKKWNPPFFLEEKSRERVFIPHTGEITAGAFFVDYNDKKDEIFIDIDFKFIDGVIQGTGQVKVIIVTPIDEVLERRKQIEESRNKRKNDPIYRMCNYFWLIINRLISKLYKVQDLLRSYEPK